MAQFGVQSTAAVMQMLERLLKPNITVSGTENLTKQPTLFVINHFTRAETFLVPYVLYRQTGEVVHSLAHHSLFRGRFGEYLRDMGVVSTKEPNRDERIIGDLMTGRANWTIYPEGAMVKTKKILTRGKYVITTPDRVGPPRTGAATLSLRAELYRAEYLRAIDTKDTRTARALERRFDFRDPAEIGKPLQIVPVTITWYPLRPGQNIIKRLAKFFVKVLPARLEEELEIEGNLLLHKGDVSIHFNEPIPVADYAGSGFRMAHRLLPFLRNLDKANPLLRRRAAKLTRRFMEEIYQNLEINFDHVYCTALRQVPLLGMAERDFRRVLYNAIVELGGRQRLRLHRTLTELPAELLLGDAFEPYQSIRKLAVKKGIVTIKGGQLTVNRVKLEMLHVFHEIRLRNPLIVLANELEPVTAAVQVIKNHCATPAAEVADRTMEAVFAWDLRRHAQAHARVADEELAIAASEGAPYLLRSPQSRVGVVLAHGYLSSPGETRVLAGALRAAGYNVYGVRLSGHGTHPAELAEVQWESWVADFRRGVAALRECCDEVIFGGFSTGGAVATVVAAELRGECDGLFAINPPWSLRAIRAHHAPAVHFWNEMLERLNIGVGRYEQVPSAPQFPDTNYRLIYVSGLVQLDGLLGRMRKVAKRVKAPTLLIRGDKDPTVDPDGVERLFDRLRVKERRMLTVAAERHVIVRGKGSKEVASEVVKFVGGLVAPPPRLPLPPEAVPTAAAALRAGRG